MELHFLPPVPGTCPQCGARHGKGEAHDIRSAYYRMRFHRANGYWPEEVKRGESSERVD